MNNQINPRQRNFVVGLIIIGLMFVGFFGLRTARAFRQFHGHRPPPPFEGQHIETDVTLIRDWMTVPFIGRMYHVPPPILFEALDIPEEGNQDRSLKQLNEKYFPEAEGVVMEKVKAAVLANQTQPVQASSDTPGNPPVAPSPGTP
jgi:hypothetical protein